MITTINVVVDSHVQRIVLATEETTVTQQVSHRPIKCQSRLWSQRGTKFNGSHHGDKPATQTNRDPNRDKKLRDSTSNGTDQHQNGSSNLLTPYREQPRSTRIVVAYPRPAFSATNWTNCAPTSFDQQVQVSQGHTLYRIRKLKYRGPWWWRPWAGEAGARVSIQPSKALCIPEKAPRILPVRRSL